MPSWDFWGWLAYASIFSSALIQAIREWRKDMNPNWFSKFFSKTLWAYAPLVLILLSAVIFITKELGWIGHPVKDTNNVQLVKWTEPYRPISVTGKKFINEKILLDGYAYDHCTFTNVTFVYNGTTPIMLSNCQQNGLTILSSENLSVMTTVAWLQYFVGFPEKVKVEWPGNVIMNKSEKP